MSKCIIYARQSFGQEQDSVSISVQVDECRKWAVAHGMQVIGEYSDANCSSEHYPLCDEGIEASRIDRGYQRWLRAQRTQGRKQYKQGLGEVFQRIAQGGVTHLLVYTRNRLGRTADGSYLEKFLTNYLLEHKVSLVTVQDGTVMDFSDDFMSLVMSIKDTLSYKELREKAKASLASIDKRINSYTKWSNAIGVVMQDGKVTFDSAYAEVIRYAYNALTDGATYGTILDKLNTQYRNLAKGRQWYQTNVRSILRNPVYCGYMRNREGVIGRAVNIP
jgi:DNA invertase Pin-like site-specific DNA recombinase